MPKEPPSRRHTLKTLGRPISMGIGLLLGVSGLSAIVPLSAQQTAPASTRPAADIGREFRQRFSRLDTKDVHGHYGLAEWCREQGCYKLLQRQALYVLKLDPKHENAKLLLRIARQNLRNVPANEQEDDELAEPGRKPRSEPVGEYLTDRDVQKLRLAELQTTRLNPRPGNSPMAAPSIQERESVKVAFRKNVLNDFLDAMSGQPNFSAREERTQFLRLPPTRQLQLILFHTGDRFTNRIEINTDPLVFKELKRVLPIVMQGCATSACHGGKDIKSFRLRTGRMGTPANLYTNFLILNRVTAGKGTLINRDKPTESLLLEYGLPAGYAKQSHPAIEAKEGRPTKIEPVFVRGPEDARYQSVLRWIQSLRLPYPRTDITLPGYPERPSPGSPWSEPADNKGPVSDQPPPEP